MARGWVQKKMNILSNSAQFLVNICSRTSIRWYTMINDQVKCSYFFFLSFGDYSWLHGNSSQLRWEVKFFLQSLWSQPKLQCKPSTASSLFRCKQFFTKELVLLVLSYLLKVSKMTKSSLKLDQLVENVYLSFPTYIHGSDTGPIHILPHVWKLASYKHPPFEKLQRPRGVY